MTTTSSTPFSSTAPPPAPSRALWVTRWAPASGIAFAVFFVVGVLVSNVPADGASDAQWLRDYSGTRNVDGHLITAYGLVLAGLSLMTFLATLWGRVRVARDELPSPVPLVAAGMAGACMSVGGVLMGVVAISALRRYPELIRLGSDGGFAMVGIAGMLAAALSVACLSVMAREAGVLGRGLATSGLVVSVLLLAAVLFLPVGALVLWVLVTSIALLRHPVAG
jgi:hypothetical protein